MVFGYKRPEMLKFVNNVILNNCSTSGKIQTSFKELHTHHPPHIDACV